jgi:hypothetical protein
LWGNGYPATTTDATTGCESNMNYGQCQALCESASDCNSFWWTKEYDNGRCCTKSAFVDNLSTMTGQQHADEDAAHGFYVRAVCDNTCTTSSGSAGEWTLWGNGHPLVTTASADCSKDIDCGNCEAVCNAASDCTSFWWTKDYNDPENGRCCTMSAFVDDPSTMGLLNHADEDADHGFYTCVTPDTTCTSSSGSTGQWTLWGNGHPLVTTGTSTPCTSDSSYAQCQAVCNGASDCTSFWWTKEYDNGRCCTKSAFVDDLSTMTHQNNADEDVSHGFYTCAVPGCNHGGRSLQRSDLSTYGTTDAIRQTMIRKGMRR